MRGLTTAASIWLASASGIACGLAQWPLVVVSAGLGLLILMLVPVERGAASVAADLRELPNGMYTAVLRGNNAGARKFVVVR